MPSPIATFIDHVTVVTADWLNYVNNFVNAGGGGGGPPLPLSVANGGTGVTSSTGNGSVVLNGAPTINSAILGGSPVITTPAITGGTVDTFPIGYKNVPQNVQSGVAYTTVLGDAGFHILHPTADVTARTFTIPANASVAYPIGTEITFINQNSAGALTIAIGGTDVMRLAGPGTTGSRTLAANGMASALKITATEWIINGTGLT